MGAVTTEPVIWVDAAKLTPVQLGRLKAGDKTVLGELETGEWGRVWPVDEWWRPSSRFVDGS